MKKLEVVRPREESSRLKSSHRTLLDSADPSQADKASSARLPRPAPSLPVIRIHPKLRSSRLQQPLDHSSKDRDSSSTHLYQKAKQLVAEKSTKHQLSSQLHRDIKVAYAQSQENSTLDLRLLQKPLTKSRSMLGGEDLNDTYLGQVTLGNSHENSQDAHVEKLLRAVQAGSLA